MIRLPGFSSAVADYRHLTRPLEQGLQTYRDGVDKAYAERQRLDEQGYQRRRNAMADARAVSARAEQQRRWEIENKRDDERFSFQRAQYQDQQEARKLELREKRLSGASGVARLILAEADPGKRQAMFDHFIGADPDLAKTLPQGIDPADGARYVIGLAGGHEAKANTPAARAAEAQRYGLEPDDPSYRQYVLTGKMPQDLTATDKRAILDADELVSTTDAGIAALSKARKINPAVNSGIGASTRAWLGNNLPDAVVPDFVSSPEGSQTTADYENLVLAQALSFLKATFGAAPTEGERQILLDLQASVGKPVAVREEILSGALAAAQRRRELAVRQAEGIRGGSYYRPSPAPPQPPVPVQTPAQPPVPVQTPDEARRLPSGTPILLPDGTTGIVP